LVEAIGVFAVGEDDGLADGLAKGWLVGGGHRMLESTGNGIDMGCGC
jgi:hypothetical protein